MLLTPVQAATCCLLFVASSALAQEHHHPPEHTPLHEHFYSRWMRPDMPTVSCCNLTDCAPTEAKMIAGRWWAKRHQDGKWLPIPPEKIELNRDSPDGRSHLCVQPPGSTDTVWCFIAGSGT